jgi:small subunit ribosomal protein S6
LVPYGTPFKGPEGGIEVREYEMMIIVDPEIRDEEISNAVNTIKEIIEKEGGSIDKIDEWGKRNLAYEIRHKKEGFYVIYYFKGNPDLPQKLRRELNLNPHILRGMVIKRGE